MNQRASTPDTAPEPALSQDTQDVTPAAMMAAMFPAEPSADEPADEPAPEAKDAAEDAPAAPEDAPAEPAKDEPKAEAKDAPKDEAKDEDEDLLTPPEGLKGRSQERFQKLANKNRELASAVEETTRERDQYREQWTALQEVIADAKMEQPQFEVAVDYIKRLNHGDLKGALEVIEAERKALILQLGEDVAAVDPLDDFPDLKGQVEALELSRKAALELAKHRSVEQVTRERHAERSTQQAVQTDFAAQRDGALTAIDRFIAVKQKSDLDFPRKEKILTAKIVQWCQGLPPAAWPAQVERMYELIGEAAPVAPSSEPRPLRSGGPGSGARPAPRTAFEAMWGHAPQA